MSEPRRQVWKFEVPFADQDELPPVSMPQYADIVHFGFQDTTPYVWAVVWPDQPHEQRNLAVYATGWDLPEVPDVLMSTQVGSYVWHLVEARA